MVLHVTLDLYARASGQVDKNITRGRRPSVFLSTRPEASVDKSNVTRKACFVITLCMRKLPRV